MDRWAKYTDVISQLCKEENIVGAAVAVSKKGEMIYKEGFGVRSLCTEEPVTPETIFGIASISKSFTALAIMQLEEQGKLSIDDPVIKHLPEFKLSGVPDMSAIKIRHLMSHTTGLPPMERKPKTLFFSDHLEYLANAEFELLGEPGQYHSYCNDTFLLLGAIIERLTGRLYRRHMTQSILDALDMNKSSYTIEEIEKLSNVSVPYNYERQKKSHEPQPWPLLGTYEVGGGVRSNVIDLLKYGHIYVNNGRANGKTFVTAPSLQKMMKPMAPVGRKTSYALGLSVTPNYNGVTLVSHGGGQPGVSSHFGFVPEEELVVAVLTNVGGVPAHKIWLAAVNTALGLPLDQEIYVETESKLGDNLDFCQRFVGTYKSAEGGSVRIFIDDKAIMAEAMEMTIPLKVGDENTLFAYVGRRQIIAQYFFTKEGEPWAIMFGNRMLQKVKE